MRDPQKPHAPLVRMFGTRAHQYVIRVPERNTVYEQLRETGIGAGIHYPRPLHLQPSMKSLGYEQGDFPRAEQASGEVLSLPIDPGLSQDQIEYVAENLKRIATSETNVS